MSKATKNTKENPRFGNLAVEYLKASELIPYVGNAKQHPDWQIDQIASSMHRFGWTAPILIDEDGMILAGHGRLLAAKRLKIAEVPCVRKTGLSLAEKQAYIIADNRLTTNTDYDMEVLENELRQILDSGEFDDLELIGFTDAELDEIFDDAEKPTKPKDDVPKVEAEVFSKTGDVFRIGPHYLVCGDSTDPPTIEALTTEMGKADMVFTDPPTIEAYVGKTKDAMTIKNDKMDGKQFLAFLTDVFRNMNAALKAGGAYYVAHADSEGLNFRQALVTAGFEIKQCCIWVKNTMVMGRQDYQWQHEPILYGWKEGEAHNWYTDRKQTTLWRFDRPQKSDLHPTMKPVDLVAYAIQNSSKKDDLVVDLFGGSGSTMVACQHTGRVNASVELDPQYVDVIVRRMNTLYPHLTITRNGEPYKPPIAKAD